MIQNWTTVKVNEPSLVTVGNFDGVHLGHQSLLKNLTEKSKQLNLQAIVVTFDPHPRLFFKKQMKHIQSTQQKVEKIQNYFSGEIIVVRFCQEFAQLNALEYIQEFLKKRLNTKMMIQGKEHIFGRNRTGNIQLLNEQFKSLKYPQPIVLLQNLCLQDHKISSSYIRKLIENKKIEQANKVLGNPFILQGTVVKGFQNGTKLGFPTANIEISENQLIPKSSVYSGCIQIDESKFYPCVVNIGIRPTIEDVNCEKQTVEAHILNFNRKIYGKKVNLKLHCFLRNEIRFKTKEDLALQIKQDILHSETTN